MSSSPQQPEHQPPLDLRSFLPKWEEMRSTYATQKKRKRSSARVIWPKLNSITTRKPLSSFEDRGTCGKNTACRVAETALTSYNLSNQNGPEYELVEVLACIVYRWKSCYHGNFIARPKNGSQEEDKLFFGEVKMIKHFDQNKKNPEGLVTLSSCILGPTGTKTGDRGCKNCPLNQPGVVQHPEDWDTSDDEEDSLSL